MHKAKEEGQGSGRLPHTNSAFLSFLPPCPAVSEQLEGVVVAASAVGWARDNMPPFRLGAQHMNAGWPPVVSLMLIHGREGTGEDGGETDGERRGG